MKCCSKLIKSLNNQKIYTMEAMGLINFAPPYLKKPFQMLKKELLKIFRYKN